MLVPLTLRYRFPVQSRFDDDDMDEPITREVRCLWACGEDAISIGVKTEAKGEVWQLLDKIMDGHFVGGIRCARLFLPHAPMGLKLCGTNIDRAASDPVTR